jgi:plastocyanin
VSPVRRFACCAGVALVALALVAVPASPQMPPDPLVGHPEQALLDRGDRYVPKPAGTKEDLRFWFGPYLVPPGHDSNRFDVDVPLRDGMIVAVEPGLRRVEDLSVPSMQEAHIHHAHWFRLDPGNPEDNYLFGNGEWIFGTGDEETRADFSERSEADPNGPIYGQQLSATGPQLMIYMLHNKTSRPLHAYLVLDVTFIHGSAAELDALGGRPYHDITGVLFGRTFDVPRNPTGDGTFSTTRDSRRGAIEWTATADGTIIGTGSHLHPGGLEVLTENMGSEQHPCPDDGRGTGGTLLLDSDAVWRDGVRFSEDFQMEVTHPAWRAPVHKGDVIRITGHYANKDNAWYTAMTHQGLYLDKAQPPQGRCKPYLINQPKPQMKHKKVRKRVLVTKRRVVRDKRTGHRVVRVTQRWKTKWVMRKVKAKRIAVTAGVPNRAWGHHKDRICGAEHGALPCDKEEVPRPPGQFTDTVTIADFLYVPGDMSLPDPVGSPPRVKAGRPLTFVNVDQTLGIRHSVTTCPWPCNGSYVANYPHPDGVWDSGTLGYDLVDGGEPNPISRTPPDLAVGKYSYFCRIHPWMRGAFEVVP